jgi:SAM-dependent methyltransferase
MSPISTIAEILANPAWLTALFTWREIDGKPQPAAIPVLGLSLPDWQALQERLLTLGYYEERMAPLGYFARTGDTIAPTKAGWTFLVSLSEIYRGEQRLPLYGKVMDYLRQAPRGAAIDIGCGAGYMLKHLAELGYGPLYGYDLLPISLEIAQAGVESVGKTATLYARDATALSEIGDGSVMMVFSRGALSYFDILRFADSLRRVLTPGAWMVFEVVGLSYYTQIKHFFDLRPRNWRKMLSIALVILRTVLFELFGVQPRLGAKTPEIGLTRRSLRRFAKHAGLRISEISPAPTTTGYLIAFQKEP